MIVAHDIFKIIDFILFPLQIIVFFTHNSWRQTHFCTHYTSDFFSLELKSEPSKFSVVTLSDEGTPERKKCFKASKFINCSFRATQQKADIWNNHSAHGAHDPRKCRSSPHIAHRARAIFFDHLFSMKLSDVLSRTSYRWIWTRQRLESWKLSQASHGDIII